MDEVHETCVGGVENVGEIDVDDVGDDDDDDDGDDGGGGDGDNDDDDDDVGMMVEKM